MDRNLFLKKLVTHDPRVTYRLPELKNRRVLVLAPHPDDETLGCGGIIFDLVQKNISVEVVLITDGSEGKGDKNISAMRLQEFEEAMRVLRTTNTIYLGFQDGHLNMNSEGIGSKLAEIVGKCKPDIIFSPYIFDYHKDHRAVAYALADCLGCTDSTIVAMYEIWTPILYPNCYINITQAFEKKLSATQCYESQEKHFDIIGKLISLNTLRAKLSMRCNTEYVEAFKCFSSADYICVADSLKQQLL